MRTVLVGLILLLYFIFSIPMYLVQYIIGKINPKLQFKVAQRIVAATFKLILFVSGVKCEVTGLENVPKDEAVLYIANHRSYFDILIGYATVPTLTSFVAKKEMNKMPCVRIWMRYMKCLLLDREDVRAGLKTILQGIEQIKEGYSIFIMPEGTRNHDNELLPFHEGSFKFAEKSGCAIIPVAMTCTDEIWEKHMPWVRKAKVYVHYGKPIYMKELPKEERKFIGSYTHKIVANMLSEME